MGKNKGSDRTEAKNNFLPFLPFEKKVWLIPKRERKPSFSSLGCTGNGGRFEMSKQKGQRSPLYFRIQMVSFLGGKRGRYGLLCILFWVRATCHGGSITLHFLLSRRFPEPKGGKINTQDFEFRIWRNATVVFFAGNNVLVSMANKYTLRFETLFKIFLQIKKTKEKNAEETLLRFLSVQPVYFSVSIRGWKRRWQVMLGFDRLDRPLSRTLQEVKQYKCIAGLTERQTRPLK